jgi:alpha-glucosidase (family GH31 glycosyl hydrolase)
MQRQNFPKKPVANSSAVIGGTEDDKYRFTVLASGLVRYEYAEDSCFEDRASTLAINRDLPVPAFRVVKTDEELVVITDRFILTYAGGPFTASSLTIKVRGNVSDWKSVWRYGDWSTGLGGTARTLDMADGRVPLGPGVVSKHGYVALDDSKSMLFDHNGWVMGRRPGDGRVDGYVFTYGLDYKDAVRALYALSGNQPVLPRWALGNWWSRYYKYSANEYLALMDKCGREKMPLAVGVIDMDWHLVDHPEVEKAGVSGWTGYTWNRELFPDPAGFLKEMHARQLKVTLNVHPADGIAPHEESYKDVSKQMGRDPESGDCIPFDIADKNFADAYFDIVHRRLEEQGVDFWWLDWQQGEYSRIAGVDPLWVLNHLHFLDSAYHGQRPITFSRFAGPGSHRYPIGFSGDTVVTWETLDFQPEFTATASNIGYGWWSHDIGGHLGGYRDNDLATRWVQCGAFSPILRLHSSNNPWNSKEPWMFDGSPMHAMLEALRLRHRMVPYLYTCNVRSARDGEPLIQPMYWAYPRRAEAYAAKNQFQFGSELMVLPVTTRRDRVISRSKIKCWFPPGRYVDIFTGLIYDGDREMWIFRDLRSYAVFAKEGAIFPFDAAEVPENGCPNPESVEVNVVVGADGVFEMIEDDGHGSDLDAIKWSKTPMRYEQKTGTTTIGPTSSALLSHRRWSVRFLGLSPPQNINATVDGSNTEFSIEQAPLKHGFTLRLKESVAASSEIAIQLGKYLSIAVSEPWSAIRTLLMNARMNYEPKVDIWAAIEANSPLGVKISRLHALDMDENLKGAIMEYMLADPR